MLFPALRWMRAQMQLMGDPVKLREAAARLDALGRPPAGVRIERVSAGTVPARWVDVAGAPQDRVLLYLHGGAFITETPVFHGALLARICRAAGARGLMVSYRLAPEHPYPAALDDCIAAYHWLLAQGWPAGRIIVAGDSAGGNLTLALLLRLRDEGVPLPACAVALSPVTDFTFSGDSVQRNDGVDDMFSADLMAPLVPVYLTDGALRTDPYVSPVFGDFTGLPPLLLIVGSTELLLDDSVRVAQRWPGAMLLVWHGMPHVFAGFEVLPEAQAAIERIAGFVRDHLPDGAGTAAVDGHCAVAFAPATFAPAPRRLGTAARLYLAVAGIAGLLCAAAIAWGVGPLLWRVDPRVWVSALGLGTLSALAAGLFLRAAFGARSRNQGTKD